MEGRGGDEEEEEGEEERGQTGTKLKRRKLPKVFWRTQFSFYCGPKLMVESKRNKNSTAPFSHSSIGIEQWAAERDDQSYRGESVEMLVALGSPTNTATIENVPADLINCR